MSEVLLWIVLVVTALNVVLLLVLLMRSSRVFGGTAELVRGELRSSRQEAGDAAREARDELATGLQRLNDSLAKALSGMGDVQRTQLEGMTRQLRDLTISNQAAQDRVRTVMDSRIRELQEGNEKKLEEMRRTVDEKLHSTLEKRLGESFKIVGDQLAAVQRGLGEMQKLATGVGDLKRVLTNVKTRGTWGEVQLGTLLEQILSPGQYERNVRTREHGSEVVEYAIRLPGPREEPGSCVWLPIDAKFPQEDYLRIQEAADRADPDAVHKATEALVRRVRNSAQEIQEKYLNPPKTTDFAVMFLATEGLFAEVVRRPALIEELQQQHRIVVAGPTTLAAMLSSLRLGFQTLAIEQQASEVWKVLRAVKTEFGKFGDVLTRVKRQLASASRTIDDTGVRTRAMARKLRSVTELPEEEASRVLELPETTDPHEGETAEPQDLPDYQAQDQAAL